MVGNLRYLKGFVLTICGYQPFEYRTFANLQLSIIQNPDYSGIQMVSVVAKQFGALIL